MSERMALGAKDKMIIFGQLKMCHPRSVTERRLWEKNFFKEKGQKSERK